MFNDLWKEVIACFVDIGENADRHFLNFCCEFESHSGEFVSDLRQVDGFLWVLRFPPPIKLTATI